jgi:endonuclease/exonuclease/phosphatase family metal-dependent hydrolase
MTVSPPLPCMGTKGLTILTWNVLLPNSVDGWWLYKYYGPGVPNEATTWSHRQALLKERLVAADPDVICLQETSEKSFASDFDFLTDAGYDCAIMNKGRMRPATFWKRDRLELCCADGSRPESIAPPPDVSDPCAPPPAEEPLPSFIESSFTCKVTYEAWVKKTKQAVAKAAEATASEGAVAAESAAEMALAKMTASTSAAVRGGAVVLQGDRILTTMLRHVDAPAQVNRAGGGEATPDAAQKGPPAVFILNCHLSAGSEARRRLRQVTDALDSVRKLLAKVGGAAAGGNAGGGAKGGKGGKGGKAKGGGGGGGAAAGGGDAASPMGPAMVVCGDFNSQGRTGVRELLVAGEVPPTFRESGDPTEDVQGFCGAESTEEVTSKVKKQSIGLFADAADETHRAGGPGGGPTAKPPPTIVAAELMSLMVDRSSGDGRPSAALIARLDQMFDTFSSDGATLTAEEEARWLMAINKAVTRGSEMRKAKALREERTARQKAGGEAGGEAGGARLHREDFHAVYADELAQGKYWGVEHDIRVVTGQGMTSPSDPPFTATFDYLYYTRSSLRLRSMLPALSEEQYAAALAPGGPILPNEWFPSDHCFVAAALEFVEA